ncbi:Elongation factor Tu C-terminal domain [Popillia japonica]|uniref:Elongation factor Tu C-terminal domain n=1 Tax=Popillia japonica TaxID=7064 RepID=A0AAW1MMC8_POPJA
MARHRNIRSMNYSDEYDYDDVYGHSVEDDYCVSPSEAAFMYNRESSKNQQIGAFIKDIAEEDESDNKESADIESCIAKLKSLLGPTATKDEMTKALLDNQLDIDKAAGVLLDAPSLQSRPEKKEKAFQQSEPLDITTNARIAVVQGVKPTANVTKGFDLSQKDGYRLNVASRSESPASGRGTPVNLPSADSGDDLKFSKGKEKLDPVVVYRKERGDVREHLYKFSKGKEKLDPVVVYRKERGDVREHLYMVVIGHVDAGKSTLMGHLLYALGQVNQKTMHKYEQESRKLGKQSFMYAWVLDETGEERNRGITMDVGSFQFETKHKTITLLDAPGHKDFIPNMISGAGHADVALLVVDATRGEFETGFDFGGQTREHALLVRSLGIAQLAVAINKLDTVSWNQERFDEIKGKLKTFLRQAGFRENDVSFVPCSGLTGQNLVQKPTEKELLAWYNGPSLIEVLDNFKCPERPITKPFRFSVNDLFKGTGSSFCVSGRVETGFLSVGERILVCPSRELAVVKGLAIEESSKQFIFAGDQASVTLSGIEMQNVAVGFILSDPGNPVQISSKFQAKIVVFNVTVPITKGFSVILHHQSLVEPAVVSKLIAQLHKNTGEVTKKHPRFLSNNTSAMVEIQTTRPIALELYCDCKELGRIMLRVGGVTIAAGLIMKIIL